MEGQLAPTMIGVPGAARVIRVQPAKVTPPCAKDHLAARAPRPFLPTRERSAPR